MKSSIFTALNTKIIFALKILAVAVTACIFIVGSATAGHWPFGLLDNSVNPSLSRGYFTQGNVTAVGPAVLSSFNATGTACSTYTYGQWQADGSPTGTQKFALPNSEVGQFNNTTRNDIRKQQLYTFLRNTYDQGTTTGTCRETQKYNGAAFMVQTMLGQSSNTVTGNRPVTNAEWNEFNNRLMQPDIYLTTVNNFARDQNAFGVRRDELAGYKGQDVRDVAVHNDRKSEPTIVIRRGSLTGTIIYAIKRRCANPTGNFPGLPSVPPPPPPAPISCGNITTNPAQPEPGESFTVRVSFDVGSCPGPDPTFRAFLNLPEAGYNNTPIGTGTAPRGGSGVEPSPSMTIPNAGQYEGSFRFEVTDATPANLVCPFDVANTVNGRPVPIVSLPYFKTYGGDIHTGASYLQTNGSCSADQNSGLLGYNRPGSGPFRGSGTQLAIFSLGYIMAVSSGQINSPNDAKNLTFANTSPSSSNYGSNTFGGGLYASGNAVCAQNYFAERPAGASSLGSSTKGTNLSAGDYYRNGNLTITGGNLGGGSNTGTRTIYVNGNATITGNIRTPSGNRNNIDHIPGFRLVVNGNIYVRPNVTELYGVYVAQPSSSSSGRFWSCWPNAKPTVTTINTTCRTSQRLTVYGAVIAERLKLTRSRGTRAESTTSERYNNSDGNPGEVFIMTPEIWLTGGFDGSGEFDSITSLPPVL